MGCAALRALSYDDDDDNLKVIDNAGGLRTVIRSMELNPKRYEVQKQGCHFLQNMVVHSADIASVISKSQVVPIILDAVSKESSDAEFKQSICGLIANLAVIKDIKESIGAAADAIPVIIATLNTTTDLETAQAACYALTNLATGSTGNQSKIAQAGGLESAFIAMESYSNDSVLLVSSLNLIQQLCISDEEIGRKTAKLGNIKIILHVMKTNLYHAMIQVAAIDVIGFLILEGKETKSAPKLATAVVASMKIHSEVGLLQVQACEALFELSQVAATRVVLKKKETQELLLRAKSHFKPCESDVDDIIASCKKEVQDGRPRRNTVRTVVP